MELSKQIKRHRVALGLSQEGLAEKIYVSRQTISNWETDNTYPDVENLLLLSTLFDTTIDELIKGDVEAMEKTIANDTAKLKIWTGAFLASSAAAVLALVGGIWVFGITGPVIAAIAALYVLAIACCVACTRIAKRNDVMTLAETLAFVNGAPLGELRVKRDRTRARRWVLIALTFALTIALGLGLGFAMAPHVFTIA